MPGVPGIGVKTAAQLICEYGDLETLLARAGEIKQEKRRQALIDNADRARLSKKLVTLDDHVPLEVPLADLAVHEPDYKRLVAFLKAMEFAALTRRVAEFSGIDAAEIEPDTKLSARRRLRQLDASAATQRASGLSAARNKQGERTPAHPAGAAGAHAGRRWPPRATEAARHAQDRPCPLRDRAHARPAQGTGSPAPASSVLVARGYGDHQPRPHAGDAVRRYRSRSRRTRLATCRSPTAKAAMAARAACSPAVLRPIRWTSSRRSRRSSRCWKMQSVLKIGQNLKFDLQMFALRGIDARPYDDTMLMSYVLDAGRSDHGLDALAQALFRSHHHRLQRGHGIGKIQDHVRLRGGATRRPNTPPRTPTSRCGCGRCSSRASSASMSQASMRRWSARLRRCWRAWSVTASRIDRRHWCSFPLNSARRPSRWKRKSTSSPASRSIRAVPSSWATSCSASSACPAERRPRPAPGQQARAPSTISPSKATSCRARFSTGGRSRSCARPIPMRCRATSIPRRTASIRATRWPRPPPAGSPPPSPTCRTFRSAPRKVARSGAPSSPPTAISSSPPTIRRSSCGCWPRSPRSRRCARRFAKTSTSTP